MIAMPMTAILYVMVGLIADNRSVWSIGALVFALVAVAGMAFFPHDGNRTGASHHRLIFSPQRDRLGFLPSASTVLVAHMWRSSPRLPSGRGTSANLLACDRLC